jgi:hypothetical protein
MERKIQRDTYPLTEITKPSDHGRIVDPDGVCAEMVIVQGTVLWGLRCFDDTPGIVRFVKAINNRLLLIGDADWGLLDSFFPDTK